MQNVIWLPGRLLFSDGKSCSRLVLATEEGLAFPTPALSSLSPDGACVAWRGEDGMLHVYQVIENEWRIGEEIFSRSLPSFTGEIRLGWSSEGARLAVQLQNEVYLYQIKKRMGKCAGEELVVFRVGHLLHEEQALEFAPGGQRIAFSTESGVALGKTLTGEALSIPSEPIQSIAWGVNKRHIALGGRDATVSVHEIERGETVRIFHHHMSPISALAWAPDGKMLVSGDSNGNLLFLKTQGQVRTWRDSACEKIPSGVAALTWSPDASQIAVVDTEDYVTILNVQH